MKNQDKKLTEDAAILVFKPFFREQQFTCSLMMVTNQNKRKRPPGINNSSGSRFRRHFDRHFLTPKAIISTIKKNYINKEFSYFNVMKKQISIFTFMIMALFAISMGNAFGQHAIHDSDPETNVLTSDALHPVAGKKYNYSISIPSGVTGNYTWWSTKDPNFISSQGANNMSTKKLTVGASNDIVAASAAYGASTATSNVDITWSSNVLLNTGYQGVSPAKIPTFVVVQFDATSGSCANNLKVYELNPKNGFMVDIRNLNNVSPFAKAAYDDNTSITQCIDKVSKASYNPITHNMEYEYGTNIFYYEVIAANFSESYKPLLTFTGLDPVQTKTIEWTYNKDFTGLQSYISGTTTVLTDAADNSTGVSIYVKVTVLNHNYEGIADKKVTLWLDGQNKDGSWDIVNSTAAETTAADKNDFAIQTLKARPGITGTTTSTTAPTNIIPGNESNNHAGE